MGFCIDPSDDISEIEGYQSALSEATLLDVYVNKGDPSR
jgi:hypothetical protein